MMYQKSQILMINLKESNKKITSNKTKHVETQKKLTDQTNKTA